MEIFWFSHELRDSLVLFFVLSCLLQLYYFAPMFFPVLYTYYPYGFVAHTFFYIAEFILLYFYAKVLKNISFSDLGFKKSEGWKTNWVIGFIFAIFHNAVYLAISMCIFKVKHGYMLPAHVHIPVYFAFYLLISVLEEGVFRGCILKGFLQKHKALTAIIFSSMLFGLYHINYISLVLNFSPLEMLFQTAYVFQSFTAGLFLAYLYYQAKGNILSPLSYHFSQMFFNIPFIWTETPPITQIILLGISSTLNAAQIVALYSLKNLKRQNIKTNKPAFKGFLSLSILFYCLLTEVKENIAGQIFGKTASLLEFKLYSTPG